MMMMMMMMMELVNWNGLEASLLLSVYRSIYLSDDQDNRIVTIIRDFIGFTSKSMILFFSVYFTFIIPIDIMKSHYNIVGWFRCANNNCARQSPKQINIFFVFVLNDKSTITTTTTTTLILLPVSKLRTFMIALV